MSNKRGFTLVELLTGIAVSSIILIAVASAVIAISGAYSNESQTRSAVEGGRTALAFIERNVRMAGYGIEPAYAFDFTNPTGLTSAKDNFIIQTEGTPPQKFISTDDLAFRYRDPAFLRRGAVGATTGTFTLAGGARMGREFAAGTAFIVACPGGGQRAWFRSRSSIAASDTSVQLTAYGSVNNAAPATALDCMGMGNESAPYLMVLKEFRFRIFVVDNRGVLAYIPALSMDLSGGIPNNAQILTSDVEDFQVAYQMNRPLPTSGNANATVIDASGNSNWVIPDAANETGAAFLPSTGDTMPTLDDSYDVAARYNRHPSNIRAVRVNLSVRSPRQRNGKATGFTRGPMENGGAMSGYPTVGDGYFRAWLTSGVRTPNMTARAFFLPPLSSTGTANGNNDGA